MVKAKKLLHILFVQLIVMRASCLILLAQEVEHTIKSIEPILTEGTLPNEVGEWGLRFSLDYSKNDEETNTTLPQVQLFFGILENVSDEISMALNYKKGEPVEYGLGPLATNLERPILDQSFTVPAIVLGLDAGCPSNSFNERSEERACEFSPYIAWLKEFGQLSVQGNIAGSTELPVSGGKKEYKTDLNFAFSYPLFGGKVDVLTEFNSSWSSKDPEYNYLKVLPITVEKALKQKRAEKFNRMLLHSIMSINDSVVITDLNDKINFVNKAFTDSGGYTEQDVLGETCTFLGDCDVPGGHFHKRKDGSKFPVSISRSVIKDENGADVAIAIVARDITERKRVEEEREKLISELKEALANVKTLHGLLPICASCKNIRDDKGYWQQVEGYIINHSGASFTHGICPDCAKKLYPDIYEKLQNKNI